MGLELGKKIRQLRKFSGMTQEQLAEKLHVSRQALSKWENDTSLPDLESVIKISRLFQISLEEKHVEENRIQETKNTEESLLGMATMNNSRWRISERNTMFFLQRT